MGEREDQSAAQSVIVDELQQFVLEAVTGAGICGSIMFHGIGSFDVDDGCAE